MNRVNRGNIVTNGVQILSVGATTASRLFKKESADSALNNLSSDEKEDYFKMKADKMRDEINKYNSGGFSPEQHMTEDELHDYQKAVAENRKKYTEKTFNSDNENKEMNVDALIASVSPQSTNIRKKVKGDVAWGEDWRNEMIEGQRKDIKNVISEVLKENK